ncbi:MAG: carbohydrate binding domain-containing protein, partial [Planctomycetes bacterium]|nr:carbohydrate binding domain-containing protein [Planctomycetota bacterium]
MYGRAVLGLTILTLLLNPAAGEELLTNGGFEGEFPGETAAGWLDNSRGWAELDVEYARDDRMPHSGNACQRITCTRLDSGAVQLIPTKSLPIERGKVYRVRGWLRGNVGAVALQLRQAPSPYRVYVEHGTEVADEWKKVDYFWTSPLDDPKGLFMLRFVAEGTLWVDDLSIREVTAEEAARLAPPPTPGNLLANGRFDLDLANWLIGHGCDYWREAELMIEPVEGNPCLKLTVPEGVHVSLVSDVVLVAPGHPVYFSSRLRASAATTITLGTTYCGSRPNLTTDWQTVTAEGQARFSPVATDHARLSVQGPVTLWIDDIVLSQEEPIHAEEQFRAAVLSDRHPLSLYHDGDRPALRLMASTPTFGTPQRVAWNVEDFWGNTRLSGEWLPEGGRSVKPLAVESLGRGWYRAAVTYGDGQSHRHESTFVILPPPERPSDAANSPFGAHFAVDPSGLALARA